MFRCAKPDSPVIETGGSRISRTSDEISSVLIKPNNLIHIVSSRASGLHSFSCGNSLPITVL
jgi:hypothetical protein